MTGVFRVSLHVAVLIRTHLKHIHKFLWSYPRYIQNICWWTCVSQRGQILNIPSAISDNSKHTKSENVFQVFQEVFTGQHVAAQFKAWLIWLPLGAPSWLVIWRINSCMRRHIFCFSASFVFHLQEAIYIYGAHSAWVYRNTLRITCTRS